MVGVHCIVLIVMYYLVYDINANMGIYQVTRRDFPFVDASRCRHLDYCGLSPEWDLKFGRVIPATAYFPGNATHTFTGNVISPMNVLIFGALTQNDQFHQILTNISSAGCVTVYSFIYKIYILFRKKQK